MLNNDVLRSLRYLLKINDSKMVDIIKLSNFAAPLNEVNTYLLKEDEAGFVACPDEVIAHFLDGLVIHLRGKDDSRPAQPIELPMTNNLILKKLRVAFELKDDDLHSILRAVDFSISKPELSALFRKAGHSNYRLCGDQLLRNFLKGLTQRVRPEA